MEARGYNPSAKRTRYRILKFSYIDFLSNFVSILLLTGIILLGIFNYEVQIFIFNLMERII